jgi:hypothetical protein
MGTVVRLAAALLISLMVFVVLVPTSGAGTQCFAYRKRRSRRLPGCR